MVSFHPELYGPELVTFLVEHAHRAGGNARWLHLSQISRQRLADVSPEYGKSDDG